MQAFNFKLLVHQREVLEITCIALPPVKARRMKVSPTFHQGLGENTLKGPSPLHSDFGFRMQTHCSLFASERSQIVAEHSHPKLVHSDVLILSKRLHANKSLPDEISQSRFNSNYRVYTDFLKKIPLTFASKAQIFPDLFLSNLYVFP